MSCSRDAGLLLESLRQLLNVDPGFRAAGVITTEMTLPMRKFRTLDATAALVETYLERIRALPGVQAAGAAIACPWVPSIPSSNSKMVGDPPLTDSARRRLYFRHTRLL